ncbi:MAG: sialidase family protein [Chthoniobacteraceae bacterium]
MRVHRELLCLLAGSAVWHSPALASPEPPTLINSRKIWDAAPHNAFTDLARWHEAWWCVFRESEGHVGGDGKIRVLTSPDGADWESAALIAEEGIDLRDPKLSVTPDDRLMLVMGGSTYRGGKELLGRQPRVAFSKNGQEWTAPQRVLAEGDWLWRVTWHDGTAYGVSYRTSSGDPALTLYRSRDGLAWEEITPLRVPGEPNETTLRFRPNGECLALVRRDGDDKQGWLGSAKLPYREWTWQPIGRAIGGPEFIVLADGRLLAAGRDYRPGGAKTAVDFMTDGVWSAALTLPSGGDTSYPGMVEHDGAVWLSYYASHEGKSAIYLAKVGIPSDESEARPARDDAELRAWLESMVWHHHYSAAEVRAVLGLSEDELAAALTRFEIRPDNIPARVESDPLLVLPYPGGRHPRIGFLDGAINPQRETKLSVFPPWTDGGYVVLDVPEALWSNLGLTYLAHTHIPTVWDKHGEKLPRLEWQHRDDGGYEIERDLPNGITFRVKATPLPDHVELSMSLTNGTSETLTDLRVQMCAMLKAVRGFEDQTNDNKVFAAPFATCRDGSGKRWIISAWQPIQNVWANAPCPCLHADPKFPDCPPGETREVHGWFSFYEGEDIQAEIARIKTAWKN